MIVVRLLGYVLFHLQYVNPDLLVDVLPLMMSRDTLHRLRDILLPFLTLEVGRSSTTLVLGDLGSSHGASVERGHGFALCGGWARNEVEAWTQSCYSDA